MNNCQLWIENLERHGQNFLYSIQHLNNLESIRNYGILSRKIIEDNAIPSRDVSYPQAQQKRRRNAMTNSDGTRDGEIWFQNITHRGYDVHEFVPLFFVKRAPMFFTFSSDLQNYFIIKISVREVCEESELILATDGNLANDNTRFITDPNELGALDWIQIRSHSPDYARPAWKRRRAAELLIYPNVSRDSIVDIITGDSLEDFA